MLFNSFSFLLFFAVAVVAARAAWSWTGRKWLLLVMSYLFYATWNPPFVLLLWLSTVVDWFIARALAAAEEPVHRRLLLILSVAVNLGVLGYFKYADLALATLAAVLAPLGGSFEAAELGLVLPVGISFYTFQTLSYTVDVYRRSLKPPEQLLDYALYVTFFPQLVAGPIVRAADFLPQCRRPPALTPGQLGWAMNLVVAGLCFKVVLADGLLAPVADRVFTAGATFDAVATWAGLAAFASQILCDFEGYSLCAIGAALALGFRLHDNFRCPYAAIGFADFWQRWHISLSTWLRDYLFLPLGGSRGGRWATARNLMLTMLLGGLWHGASWRFVAWGGLHGAFLVIERELRGRVGAWPGWRSGPARVALGLATFLLVCLSWVPFRAPSFAAAVQIYRQLVGLGDGGGLKAALVATAVVVTVAIVVVHWLARERGLGAAWLTLPSSARVALLSLMILTTVYYLVQGDDVAFIYFQF